MGDWVVSSLKTVFNPLVVCSKRSTKVVLALAAVKELTVTDAHRAVTGSTLGRLIS